MTTTQTPDPRLALALRALAAHGIAVRRAEDDPAGGAHAGMVRAELAARYPAGMGSYVLWASAGDAYTLHAGDPQTAVAVAAACHSAGIPATRDGAVVTARPATLRPAIPAHDPSPWRWLEARAA